mgnify:CR=1 FL=1
MMFRYTRIMNMRMGRIAGILLSAFVMGLGCSNAAMQSSSADDFSERRKEMVRMQLELRDIENERVLEAMRQVPRHEFVPDDMQDQAYGDYPLPIGYDQTISQPYIVGLMTQLLEPKPDDKVLEIGTGSGYQAAILAELCGQVYTIEIVEELGKRARKLLTETMGYENMHVRIGDGYQGWPEHAPFDKIILTAAPEEVPQPLLDQLAEGGRMVAPVGGALQELYIITKDEEGIHRERVTGVRFVPMTGEAQEQ